MDIAIATQIAEEYVARLKIDAGVNLLLLRDKTIERDFGWVFFYGPQDESIAIAGNAPFVVDRDCGSIHVTGTAYPIEAFLDSFARTGKDVSFGRSRTSCGSRGMEARGAEDILNEGNP